MVTNLYALQIKKNDRWIFCTNPGDGRLIVSQDQAKFEGFGDRFRVIEFPGFVDHDAWENCLVDSNDNSAVPQYTVSIVAGETPEPTTVLRYAELSEALEKFENSKVWSQDALVTMSPVHYRALKLIKDPDNKSLIQREEFLGDAPETLFGYPIEVRKGETNILIHAKYGAVYSLA